MKPARHSAPSAPITSPATIRPGRAILAAGAILFCPLLDAPAFAADHSTYRGSECEAGGYLCSKICNMSNDPVVWALLNWYIEEDDIEVRSTEIPWSNQPQMFKALKPGECTPEGEDWDAFAVEEGCRTTNYWEGDYTEYFEPNNDYWWWIHVGDTVPFSYNYVDSCWNKYE